MPASMNKPEKINHFEAELLKSLHTGEEDDEAANFGRTVAARLRRLVPYKAALAETRILQVLIEIEFDSPNQQ